MIMINTLGDLWSHFAVYPGCIRYFLEDDDIMGYIEDMDEMQRFFDEYLNYEVIDFSILLNSSESIKLGLVLKKGEPGDE